MKRTTIALVVVVALGVAAAAVSAATVFSTSGTMKFGQPLTGTFTTAAYQDLTITGTVTAPKAGTSYLLALQHFTPNGYENQGCLISFLAPATSASCSVTDGLPGRWVVTFKPRAGKYGAAVGAVAVTSP